jgi:CMP-N-acetylneuraminic acid synthetase
MKSLNEIAVVVQARYNSERVPFKMSQGINDYPFASTSLLDIVLEKLTKSEVIQNEHIYLSVHEEGLIQIGEKYPINIHKRSWETPSSPLPLSYDGMFSVVERKNYFWNTKGEMLNKWPEGQDLLNTKAVETTYEAGHCLYGSKMSDIGKGKWVGSWTKKNDPVLFPVSEFEAFDIDEQWQFDLVKSYYEKQN